MYVIDDDGTGDDDDDFDGDDDGDADADDILHHLLQCCEGAV